MEWIIFFGLIAGVAWLVLRPKARHKATPMARRAPPEDIPVTIHISTSTSTSPQWHDPLDDIDPDSVIYNGYKAATARVRIRYTSGQGQASEREVSIQSYDDTIGIGMFEGFCHLRGAQRSFYFARVGQAVDAETGEVINDLRAYLNAQWEQGTGPAVRLLFTEHNTELEVLLFMAKADKAIRAAELEIITQYCRDVTGDQRLDTATIRAVLNHAHLTSLLGFKQKIGALQREPQTARRVAAACRAIVATQKTIHPDELAALDYLDKKLPLAPQP